jgi:ABC-type antimicrobial peptide transport system permease subunit
MTGPQILKMILIEGLFIGKIGGLLAIFLGIPLGWVSIQALNMLSVFKVNLILSTKLFGLIFLGAILVSTLAAFYPALIGFRLKTSESIHYE